jgi:hypothetical protein
MFTVANIEFSLGSKTLAAHGTNFHFAIFAFHFAIFALIFDFDFALIFAFDFGFDF